MTCPLCAAPGLFKGHKDGPAYCRRHRATAVAIATGYARGLAAAEAHAWHEWRQSWVTGPEASARRWRVAA